LQLIFPEAQNLIVKSLKSFLLSGGQKSTKGKDYFLKVINA